MKRILVIDDSPEVRSLISDMLSLCNFTVMVAEDGIKGSELAELERPDLILCDLHMPELDGIGTLRRLRETPGTAAIPFLFLTGAADHPHVREGMELGAAGYVPKPFALKELLEAVNARL